MRPKRIPQSKSKSQTLILPCGCQRGFYLCPEAERLWRQYVASDGPTREYLKLDYEKHFLLPDDIEYRWNEYVESGVKNTIAKRRKRPLQPLPEPEPQDDVPLVHIGRYNGLWCVCEGHVRSPIPGTIVPTLDDPMEVALYLISHAKGPINVAW